MTSSSKFELVRAANVWTGEEGWELLFYYNLYRFGLAIVLVILSSPDFTQSTIDYESWVLIAAISGFSGISIVSFLAIKHQRPPIHIQAHILFSLDIVFISMLHLANVLPDSNTVVFYITTVGAAAVMFRTKTALGYASLAIGFIYLRETLEVIRLDKPFDDFYFAALTAIGLFAIVVIVSLLARRTRVVQNVLEQQELDLADLDEINQLVIDQLDIGILFLDDNMEIKMINDPARDMVGEFIEGEQVSEKLGELIEIYMSMPSGKHFTFRHKGKIFDLGSTPMRNGLLVRIEDRTKISRRIQDTKLSSVGRFASAISHEIRNPLHAINHAAQLIRTDPATPENDEMISIIRKHVKRINDIIESILERSRPGKVQQQEILLDNWLDEYIETFRQSIGDREVSISRSGPPVVVYFDPTQLEQILTNLCQNGVKYARTGENQLEIMLATSEDKDGVPCLHVSNNGKAIPARQVDKLFEPFFTTDSKSTGLGLYLSREFCRLNGSDIQYYQDRQSHGFRISFNMVEPHT